MLLGAFVAVYVADRQLPVGMPGGVVVDGLIIGSLNGLLAMGLVFVYRANQIINFAQGELGAFAATLSYELISQSGVPYAVAAPISILAAVLVAGAVEIAVLRRFSNASRMVLTVVTIGLAQVLLFAQLIIPPLFERYTSTPTAGRLAFPGPLPGRAFVLSGQVFSGDTVMAMVAVPAILVGLAVFFRKTWTGIAIRATAQNSDRAGLLGVPVARLGTLAWVIAGGLSAVAAILRAPITGYFPGDLAGVSLLAQALAAAAVGRFESLGVTFLASLALAVVEQVFVYNFPSHTGAIDMVILVVAVAALLIRPPRAMRAAWGATSSWRDVAGVRPVPPVLSTLPEVRAARLGLAAVLAAGVLGLPLVLGTAQVRLASVVLVYAIVAASLVVLTGWAGQVSLGQWALVGIGGFTVAKLTSQTHPPSFVVLLLVAGAASAAVSVLLGLPALRQQGLTYGVTTLAFAVATGDWLFNLTWWQADGTTIPRPALIGHWPLASETRFYYVVLGVTACCLVAIRNLRRSRLGRLLVASRDNERVASCFGAPVNGVRLTAFALAGFMCGLAGGLYVTLVQTASAQDFPADTSVLAFGMGVIGGLGSVTGAVAGAVYVLGTQYLLPSWGSFLATGLGVIIFLLAFPGGLGQLIYAARDAFLGRVAARHDIPLPSLVADRRLEPPDVQHPLVEES